MSPYQQDPDRITYFAETDARGKKMKFGIKAKDRSKHMYVIGKTGMGKSTLLENMAIQDIQNGEGIAFIDPHGSTAEKLIDYIPEDRLKDVVYFAPFDMDYPVAFNVMEDVGYDKRHLVVSGIMSAFKKIWVDAWSGRMEYILTNTMLALLEYPESTLLDVNRMYTNKVFRKRVVDHITDPIVKEFWAEEFASYTDRYTQEATPAIQNKVGQFTSNPLIRNIIGQPQSTFDLREIMDDRKIFIANLSKGRLGETNADLLGSILTTKIYLSAMSRADLTSNQMAKLPDFYFYVDEFQSIANDSFADILSEARKYKLNLTIAHQYIEQMEENVRNAVFGNVGTTVTFRVGPFDAEVLETVFKPYFLAADLVNLAFAQVYLTLMIDGVGSKPFSATTMAPIEPPKLSYRDQIINSSRSQFGRERSVIENEISKHSEELGEKAREMHKEASGQPQRRPPDMRPRRSAETKGPRVGDRSTQKSSVSDNRRSSLGDLVKSTQKDGGIRTQDIQANTKREGPNESHLAELRNTLTKIVGDTVPNESKKIDTSHTKKPNPVQAPPRRKVDSKDIDQTESEKTKEVPEDVLRKLLDVEKE